MTGSGHNSRFEKSVDSSDVCDPFWSETANAEASELLPLAHNPPRIGDWLRATVAVCGAAMKVHLKQEWDEASRPVHIRPVRLA